MTPSIKTIAILPAIMSLERVWGAYREEARSECLRCYHLDRLAPAAVGLKQPSLWMHALVLLGFAILFLGLAVRRLRRHG